MANGETSRKRQKLEKDTQLSISSFFASPSRTEQPMSTLIIGSDCSKNAPEMPLQDNQKPVIRGNLNLGMQKPPVGTHQFAWIQTSAKGNQKDASRNVMRERWKRKLDARIRRAGPPYADSPGDSDDVEMQLGEEMIDSSVTPNIGTSKGGNRKLTPLEQQFVDLKEQHGHDTILLIEVGYKFRFFGKDAEIASKILHIFCFPGRTSADNIPSELHYARFAGAMIPEPRLMVHVRRLVYAGYKVGIVRQTETAALKAAGANKSALFERKLTDLYTHGTFLDDLHEAHDDSSAVPTAGFLLCILETVHVIEERVGFNLFAVQPATGEVVYDEFEDSVLRSELETRLLHLQPCEIIICGDLSPLSRKVVKTTSCSYLDSFSGKIRIESVSRITPDQVSSIISEYAQTETSVRIIQFHAKIDTLSHNLKMCLANMLNYLKTYGLQNVFSYTKTFITLSSRQSTMLLTGNTLLSLEIFKNQTDFSEKGSLFWLLNHTKTKFGQRLLKKWISRPLLDRKDLESRAAAVQEMFQSKSGFIETIRNLLSKLPDLEKGLCKIYYRKCSRSELLIIVNAFRTIANTFPVMTPENVGFKSALLNFAFSSFSQIRDDVRKVSVFNSTAARENNKVNFFNDEKYEDIMDIKLTITALMTELDELLNESRTQLNLPGLKYVTILENEYLVEVSNVHISKIPSSWVKVNGTKSVSRFRSSEIIKLLNELDQHKERLIITCDAAYLQFLAEISSSCESFHHVVNHLALLDCIQSLAVVATHTNYCRPSFSDSIAIDIQESRHPMNEQFGGTAFVANDAQLNANGLMTMLVTGPNMGGKSSYVRQLALIQIMGQIGSYVPAKTATLALVDGIFTRMGAFDNILAGESTFMIELHETSEIMRRATSKSLVIIDELGRGTSTMDGVAIAHAVLHYLITTIRCLTLFVTHYPSLAKFANIYPGRVGNFHMSYLEQEKGSGWSEIIFMHKVISGISQGSYGLNVARLAGLPCELIRKAMLKSSELEKETTTREQFAFSTSLCKLSMDMIDAEHIKKILHD